MNADRPTPPVPAAEDDAVERAARALYVATAKMWVAHDEAVMPWAELHPEQHERWRDHSRAALDAAGVPALVAEVERWHVAALQATAGEGQARQQVADLRVGIEALRDKAARLGLDEAAEDANVLLAEPGEQPGEGTHTWQGPCCVECEAHVSWCDSPPAPVVPDHSLNAVCLLDGCVAHGTATAPAVPDSAKSAPSSAKAWSNDSATLRERIDAAVEDTLQRYQVDPTRRSGAVDEITDAVLAVVGQGVTGAEGHDPHAALAPELVSLLADWDANDEDDNYSKGDAARDLRATLRRACGCERGHLLHARRCPERLDHRPAPSTTTTEGDRA